MMTTSDKSRGGENGGQGGNATFILSQRGARILSAAPLFHRVDQGAVIATSIRLFTSGEVVDQNPFMSAYFAPVMHEAQKRVYRGSMTRLNRRREVSLLAFFTIGKFTFVTLAGRHDVLNSNPGVLDALRAALACIQNREHKTQSRRVFFAGDIGEGLDIASFVYNNETKDWKALTRRGQPGIIIAEVLKPMSDGAEQVLVYRTDEQGRSMQIMMASLTDISANPDMLLLPTQIRWQLVADKPSGVSGHLTWMGRLKRDPARPASRVGMLGMSGNRVVPFTLHDDARIGIYGPVEETTFMPASVFRIGDRGRAIALIEQDLSMTYLAVGAGLGLPSPYDRQPQLQLGA